MQGTPVSGTSFPSVLIILNFTRDDAGDGTMRMMNSELPLANTICEEAAPHPITGGTGIRIRGELTTDQLGNVFGNIASQYNMTIQVIRPEYFLAPFSVTDVNGFRSISPTTALDTYPPAAVSFLRQMSPSLSPWWPIENYSKSEASNVPRRCYASSPIADDHSRATLYVPNLVCDSGGKSLLLVEVVNDTSFCC
ncbi:Hypothetical protein, putative [Bodo saltans]|uniref:Uncharacterized protein n=1 Tax=Bodo saltans TaxID=75058 RepID=A0A0S4JA57_BODSA|nr:Hypothetical protein, putative [Bodo saltans]|eukprot:CUG86370.1 Hypothetical protein, putative [Bodo saltans]